MKLKYMDSETHDVRLKDSNISEELIKELVEKHMRVNFEQFKSVTVSRYKNDKNYVEIYVEFDVDVEEDTTYRPYMGWYTEYNRNCEDESSVILKEMEQAIKEYIDEE